MSSDLEYSLGLNTSPFTAATEKVVAASEEIGKRIVKKFEMKDLGRTLSTALGLNLETLAGKLVEPFKESAESAERIAAASDRSAAATERLIALRQTDLQQLGTMEKQLKRINDAMKIAADSKPSASYWAGIIDRGSALDKLFGFSRREDAARAEAVAVKEAEAKEKSLEIEIKKENIKKQNAAEETKRINELAAEDEKLAAAKERRAELEREERLAGMSDAERQVVIAKELEATEAEIAKYKRFELEGGKLTAQGTTELNTLLEKQKGLRAQIKKEVVETVAADAGNIAAWTGFILKVGRTGDSDRGLTDKELARKASNLRRDISQRETSQFMESASIGGGAMHFDPLLSQAQLSLTRVKSEQDFRAEVRQSARALGTDRTLDRYSGLTEQKLAELVGTASETSKSNQFLREIRDALVTKGIITIPLTRPAPSGG